MRRIDYYVACSLDGYIEGQNGDISSFTATGEGVSQYLNDLNEYTAVIMGRKTYEFGYQYGLKPGSLAYQHMEHFVISSSLTFSEQDERLHVIEPNLSEIMAIKNSPGSPIYLCGGGHTAAWLLENKLIDRVKIKFNPILLGSGTRLFGPSVFAQRFKLMDAKNYSDGIIIATYEVL